MQPVNFDLGSSLLQNPAGTPVPSVAVAGTFVSADLKNDVRRGLKLVIDITAIAGTSPTVTVTIQGKDPVSGKYYTLLASAALAATGTTTLTIYPGIATVANASVDDVLPATWRISVVVGGTGPSATMTIGGSLLV